MVSQVCPVILVGWNRIYVELMRLCHVLGGLQAGMNNTVHSMLVFVTILSVV